VVEEREKKTKNSHDAENNTVVVTADSNQSVGRLVDRLIDTSVSHRC